jgi:hypothetical protein
VVRQTFEIPLDIPDVTIENVTTNRLGHIEIRVRLFWNSGWETGFGPYHGARAWRLW